MPRLVESGWCHRVSHGDVADARGCVLPCFVFQVTTRALVFTGAEAIDVWPCCVARDERQLIWAKSHYVTVLVVLSLDPAHDVAHAHDKHRWQDRGASRERTGDVSERVKEDIIDGSDNKIEEGLDVTLLAKMRTMNEVPGSSQTYKSRETSSRENQRLKIKEGKLPWQSIHCDGHDKQVIGRER